MVVRPRVLELTSEVYGGMITDEATVAAGTEAIPVGRFIKDNAGGVELCDTAGEKCMAVSIEHPIPSVSGRQSDFADYAVGDTCVFVRKAERYVLIEASDQNIASIDKDDKIGTDADGKAVVTATTGHYVLGVQPGLVTYGGVKYIRFIPNWLTKEVVP